MIVGLFPELKAVGGIQCAGRHIAAVLADFARRHGMKCRLFSLNDTHELHRMVLPSPISSGQAAAGHEFMFMGYERGKVRLGAAAMRAAWGGARVAVAAHPHLALVTQGMRAVRKGLRTIVWTHGIEVWEPLPLLRRRALGGADLVLAPSRDTAQHVAAMQQVPCERIRVLPWALDPQFAARTAAAAAKVGLPGTFPVGRVILTVGRWSAGEEYKGVDHLIAALPRLLCDWPDVRVVAVGEGDGRAWLEHLAAEHGVQHSVHFLPQVSQAELAACYAACEIFALPSRGEGFGFVYLEAMSHGKPVIAGAHAGAPEVVEDGVTGFLVPHGDVQQLTTALRTLLASPGRARDMGAKGRARVEKEFQFEKFASTLEQILREQCEF